MGKNVPFWSPSLGDQVLTAALLAQIGGFLDGGLSTSITTAGNGTLTAAAMVGGIVTRTGPTGAYTDTTDTAAALVTALGGFQLGQIFSFGVKNATAFVDTLAGGTGVTFSGQKLIPPFSTGYYTGTVGGTAASPTITMAHVISSPINIAAEIAAPQATALATVGAGTITAAGINGGIVSRGGSQSGTPFTDTTDTVANLLAGISALATTDGTSAEFTYVNNTNAVATIAGASNVTITGQTMVEANSWVKYLVTRTSATAVSLVVIGQGFFPKSGTFTANGASAVVVSDASVTAGSVIVFTAKTIGGTPAGAPFLSAVTPGTGFSVKAAAGDTSVYNYKILG